MGYSDYEGDSIECDSCEGFMVWCDTCEMYTQTCCEDYGTCACS